MPNEGDMKVPSEEEMWYQNIDMWVFRDGEWEALKKPPSVFELMREIDQLKAELDLCRSELAMWQDAEEDGLNAG